MATPQRAGSAGAVATNRTELSCGELRAELVAVFAPYAAAASATPADLDRAARWLVEAEVLGLGAFGLSMLVKDLARIGAPAAGVHSAPAVSAPGTAILSLDGAGVPGPLALAVAVSRAGSATATHGIGLVGLRRVGALGVLGLAARDLALEGRVALVAAQAPAIVAPWGSSQPAIGTNPIAIATPRRNSPPLVADFATAPLTLAELRARTARGERLPEGVAVDTAGDATLDPARVFAILPESLVGSLGGLLVELLAGVAVGGRETGPGAAGRGAMVLAFDPARAGGGAAADDAARLAADWVHAGGHLPARFDALGNELTLDSTARVQVESLALTALRAAADAARTSGEAPR